MRISTFLHALDELIVLTRKATNWCCPRVETGDKAGGPKGDRPPVLLSQPHGEFLPLAVEDLSRVPHKTWCHRGTESRCVERDSPGRCQQELVLYNQVPQDKELYRDRRNCSGQPTELCPQYPQSVMATPPHGSLKLSVNGGFTPQKYHQV